MTPLAKHCKTLVRHLLVLGTFYVGLSVTLDACQPAPVVRVWKDINGQGPTRNFDPGSYFSDMTNDYFENNGGQMGGAISGVANFSDKYIVFGERPDGVFGHGGTVCIAPQTMALNLTDVDAATPDNCAASCDPDPYGPGTCFFVDCAGERISNFNFNDKFWSYIGTANDPYWDCGPLIRSGLHGTIDLTKY